MTCMKITESQNGQIYPEDTFSHGAAQIILIKIVAKKAIKCLARLAFYPLFINSFNKSSKTLALI